MGPWNSPGNVVNTEPLELKILLVGPRRTGKSSVGNTLLGRGRVFETRGGGASAAASGVNAGRHVTVVDAQGWSSSENSKPREEKIELLRALDLCGSGGPHVILLVIPLLDFTEPERRAIESRMEILTSGVWRHTMVLFTFEDWLKGRGRSVEQHIQSGGSALQWLMEKCRYRYHVLNNKMAVTTKQERRRRGREARGAQGKGAGRRNGGGEADGRREGGQEQVRELLGRVEDMLQENGGWHFSLHMYHRLEEEWSRREQELRARIEAEKEEERVKGGRETEERRVKTEGESEQRLKMEGEEEDSLRKEREEEEGREEKMEKESVERGINMEEQIEERVMVKIRRQSSEEKDSEEEEWDTGSDSGGEREEEGGEMIEGAREESTEVKTGMMALYRPNGGQRLAFCPVRRLA